MALQIVRNDITHMKVDAIVNSANPDPLVGFGVDRAIHIAAGPELLAARKRIGALAPGHAAATPGFNLETPWVIHVVGPLWKDDGTEAEVLQRCYTSCLEIATELGCQSIAFPLISTGAYGFPKALALTCARETIRLFLEDHDIEVFLVVFDRESFQLSSALQNNIASFINDAYISEVAGTSTYRSVHYNCSDLQCEVDFAGKSGARRELLEVGEPDGLREFDEPDELGEGEEAGLLTNLDEHDLLKKPDNLSEDESLHKPAVHHPRLAQELTSARLSAPEQSRFLHSQHAFHPSSFDECNSQSINRSLEDVLNQVSETFSQSILRLIDERKMSDPEVYKRANLDRKLFSKIRSNPNYRPTRQTAIALAVALQLNLDETRDLLGRAGYALSRSSKADLIVEYFVTRGQYDIFTINEALFAFDQPLIGR